MKHIFLLFFFVLLFLFPLSVNATVCNDITDVIEDSVVGDYFQDGTEWWEVTSAEYFQYASYYTKYCSAYVPADIDQLGPTTRVYSRFTGVTDGDGSADAMCYIMNDRTTMQLSVEPVDCEIPDPCPDLYNDAIAACGSAGQIANFTCAPDNVPPVMGWTCTCYTDSMVDAEAECAAKGGLNYYDTELCQPICNDCSRPSESKCEFGIFSYNNNTCSEVCKDCNSEFYQCAATCGGINEIKEYSCREVYDDLGIQGSLYTICDCNEEPDIIDDPPILPPGDEYPDGETPPGNTDPDGTNDNALLGDIVDNTRITGENVRKVGDILDKELNESNAALTNIHARQGDAIKRLDDISDASDESNAHLQNVASGVENLNSGLDDIDEGLGDVVGAINGLDFNFDNSIVEANTESIKNTNQEIIDKLNANDMEQADIDGILSGFENSTQTAWESAVSSMDTSISGSIDGINPVSSAQEGSLKSFFTDILPTPTACIPLDLSFQDKEIILSCDISDSIKLLLSYILYISTIFTIFTIVHKELRPNA